MDDVHERFARQAIELARQAREAGNHPFGALLVLDGNVVASAQKRSSRIEIRLRMPKRIWSSRAIREMSPEQIRRSVLYTSCEPCAMCVGKMYWAGIRSIAYALPAEELAKLAGGSFLVPCRELFARAAEPVTVIGPLLLNEARDVHLGYWPAQVVHES